MPEHLSLETYKRENIKNILYLHNYVYNNYYIISVYYISFLLKLKTWCKKYVSVENTPKISFFE